MEDKNEINYYRVDSNENKAFIRDINGSLLIIVLNGGTTICNKHIAIEEAYKKNIYKLVPVSETKFFETFCFAVDNLLEIG